MDHQNYKVLVESVGRTLQRKFYNILTAEEVNNLAIKIVDEMISIDNLTSSEKKIFR